MHPDLVCHVQHLMLVNGRYIHAITDLIFVDNQPLAVLEWGGRPGKERPRVSVPLDPAQLTEMRSGHVTHLYDGPAIVDPREALKTPRPTPDQTR